MMTLAAIERIITDELRAMPSYGKDRESMRFDDLTPSDVRDWLIAAIRREWKGDNN